MNEIKQTGNERKQNEWDKGTWEWMEENLSEYNNWIVWIEVNVAKQMRQIQVKRMSFS